MKILPGGGLGISKAEGLADAAEELDKIFSCLSLSSLDPRRDLKSENNKTDELSAMSSKPSERRLIMNPTFVIESLKVRRGGKR